MCFNVTITVVICRYTKRYTGDDDAVRRCVLMLQ